MIPGGSPVGSESSADAANARKPAVLHPGGHVETLQPADRLLVPTCDPGTDTDDAASTAFTAAAIAAAIVGSYQPLDADLTAIAGLTSAADKGIHFTGSGTAATHDLTTAGRALLDDADAAAQRSTLGLGTLATQSGTFSGTSSGTNTGDQTITLTGDVTGSGTGSFAATVANDAVTYAKMQNVSATDKILGRSTAGAGDVEEITCTSYGRDLLDDTSVAAQRTTLGLGTAAVQIQTATTATQSTGSTTIPVDDTIPQNTEGDEWLTVSITPKSATSTLKISFSCHGGHSVSGSVVAVALFQDSTANALQVKPFLNPTANTFLALDLLHKMVSGTTSATTLKIRIGGSSGTYTMNGAAATRYYGGAAAAVLTVEEYLP